jgi:alkylation response protein AidB-like acyl-CoA dehydrogenase
MDFAFSAEQEMLRDTARRFLSDKAGSAVVRQIMESDSGFDAGLWSEISRQGWPAMHIPEEYGGAGFSYLELVVLMEEMGAALFPAPFFSSIALGANALLIAGSEEQKKELLPAVAAGEVRLAVAQLEESGGWGESGILMEAATYGTDFLLSGRKMYVVDGHTATSLVVAARTDAGVSLFLVDGDAAGVSRSRVETMDMTRKQAEVSFDAVRVPSSAMIGADGSGWTTLSKVTDLAAVALAAECVGGAQRCLDMSVEYAKVRVQFGRPIGSFQAIKHKCADMLVQVESARSAAYYAGWAAAEDNDELGVVAPLAKSYCSEAFFFCASENIQIHGGIGFTWEHDAHLYFKRAKTAELLLGSPAHHRALLADRLGL